MTRSTSQTTTTNQEGHEWIKLRGAEPELCLQCGLHRAAFINAGEKTLCDVKPEWRPTEDPQPDDSDIWAVHEARTLAVRFCKGEGEAMALLRSDARVGPDAQGWRGPIPIRSAEVRSGAAFAWDSLSDFLMPEGISKRFSHLSMDRNMDRLLASGGGFRADVLSPFNANH